MHERFTSSDGLKELAARHLAVDLHDATMTIRPRRVRRWQCPWLNGAWLAAAIEVPCRIPRRARAFCLEGGTRRPRRVADEALAKPAPRPVASPARRDVTLQLKAGTVIGVSRNALLAGRNSPRRTRVALNQAPLAHGFFCRSRLHLRQYLRRGQREPGLLLPPAGFQGAASALAPG